MEISLLLLLLLLDSQPLRKSRLIWQYMMPAWDAGDVRQGAPAQT